MSNKNTFVANSARIEQIGLNQNRIDDLKDDAKGITAESQGLKLDTYCHLIAGIAPAKLTSKSNLNTKDRVTLKGDLMDKGNQTDSMADKLIKNAVGARNVFGIGGDNWTPAAVKEIFDAKEITSEAKLIKAVSGDDQKSPIDQLAAKIVGRRSTKKNDKGERVAGDKWIGGMLDKYAEATGTDLDEVLAELYAKVADDLRERRGMEASAQEAGDQTAQDNADVNEMLEKL
tara:strand:+ start:1013 stop:1705 length:693 start_codon:yes stop_codon:yes gene_type:complete